MSELISVIIPVYNGESTVKRCVDSILKQSRADFEIIIVNDGSSDNSCSIIKALADEHKNIRVIDTENKGVSSARNTGLDASRGRYIVFADCDDEQTEDCLTQLYHSAAEHKDKLVMCAILSVRKNGHYIRACGGSSASWVDLYCKGLLSSPVNKIYDSRIIKQNNIRFEPQHKNGEDLLFNIEYIKYVNGAYVVDKPLYIYYENDGKNLHTQCNAEKFDMIQRAYTSLLSLAEDEESVRRLKKSICEEYIFSVGQFCMREKNVLKKLKQVFSSEGYKQTIDCIYDIDMGERLRKIMLSGNPYFIMGYFWIKKLRGGI